MRHVEGYVCVGIGETKWPYRVEIFYGKAVDSKFDVRGFETFSSNDFITFDTVETAEVAGRAIKAEMRSFDDIKIGWLRMEIAESNDESMSDPIICQSKSLVAIWKNDMGDNLMGRYVEDKLGMGCIPGARLDVNGIVPIHNHETAIHIASETSRQSGCSPVYLADFEFRWIR